MRFIVGLGITDMTLEVMINIKTYDSFNTTLESDYLFLCLPTPFSNELRGYDYSSLHETLKILDEKNYKGPLS